MVHCTGLAELVDCHHFYQQVQPSMAHVQLSGTTLRASDGQAFWKTTGARKEYKSEGPTTYTVSRKVLQPNSVHSTISV